MSKSALPDKPENHLVVFQEKAIRRTWHNEEWWFSVVDVCGVLTDSPDAGAYWRKLKQRLGAEGSEVVTFCHGFKLEAPDGKQRDHMTDLELIFTMLGRGGHHGNRATQGCARLCQQPQGCERRRRYRRQCAQGAGSQKRQAGGFGRKLFASGEEEIGAKIKPSSPNIFIGDPWFRWIRSWIPDQKRFGNDGG